MLREPTFSVAILAGGRSSRMGCDKAMLVHNGATLLARQVDLAWCLSPAEVFVVGRTQDSLGELRAKALVDRLPGSGPLGGLASVLAAAAGTHVVALAVDMPGLSGAFLARLLGLCSRGRGVVPRTKRGWEPLAAVYPTCLAGAAAEALATGDLGLGRFVQRAEQAGLLRPYSVRGEERYALENWNTPADIARSQGTWI